MFRHVASASLPAPQLSYDYLVLATGATHSYFGKNEWAPFAPGLKTIEDALEIRRRVLLAFELAERQMQEHGWHPPLNFVVIGGGPTGVELAGRHQRHRPALHAPRFPPHRPAQERAYSCSTTVRASWPPIRRISPPKPKRTLFDLGVEVHTKSTRHRTSGPAGLRPTTSASMPPSPSGPPAFRPRRSARCSGAPTRQARLRHRRRPPQSPRPARSLRPRRPRPFRAGRPPGSRRRATRHADGRPRRQDDRRRSRTEARARPSATSTRATWPPSAAWPPSPRWSGPSRRI